MAEDDLLEETIKMMRNILEEGTGIEEEKITEEHRKVLKKASEMKGMMKAIRTNLDHIENPVHTLCIFPPSRSNTEFIDSHVAPIVENIVAVSEELEIATGELKLALREFVDSNDLDIRRCKCVPKRIIEVSG